MLDESKKGDIIDYMKEQWKDIKDYEGEYQISNLGRIKSLKRRTPFYITPHSNSCIKDKGYYKVLLYKHGVPSNYYVHRLVAEHFIPNPNNKSEVNHIDFNKANNTTSNLEWVDRVENVRHLYKSNNQTAFKRSTVKCLETGAIYRSIADAARATEIKSVNIRAASDPSAPNATAGGYHWVRLVPIKRQ